MPKAFVGLGEKEGRLMSAPQWFPFPGANGSIGRVSIVIVMAQGSAAALHFNYSDLNEGVAIGVTIRAALM